MPQILVKRRLTVRVHLIDHVLELRFCRILTQGPHDGTQFLSSDGAIAILIKQTERLSELYTKEYRKPWLQGIIGQGIVIHNGTSRNLMNKMGGGGLQKFNCERQLDNVLWSCTQSHTAI